MVEKLIPNYDFVKNWSEDQLRDLGIKMEILDKKDHQE